MEYYPTLQGMCEVVMNDEDGDAPSQEASESYLPPIPQFDLQFEHLGYAMQEEPVAPMVYEYPPYATCSQPFQNILDTRLVMPSTSKQRIPPKAIKKDVAVEKREKKERKEFLWKLFPKEFSGTVFSKQSLKDKEYSEEEKKFYDDLFSDVQCIELCRTHCTICDKHIGCGPIGKAKAETHMMLDVLICKDCHEFYGDGKFPLDKLDDTEIYCRWCGQGGDQICCSFCPKVFCNKCVKRNFGLEYLKNIQAEEDWACFCCAAKPLWPLRSIRRALKSYFDKIPVEVDNAMCCVKRQKKVKDVEPVQELVKTTRKTVRTLAPKPQWTGPNQPFVLVDKLAFTASPKSPIESPTRQTRTAMVTAAASSARPNKIIFKPMVMLPSETLPSAADLTSSLKPSRPNILGRPRITPVPLSRLTKAPPPPPPPVISPQPRGRGRPRLHPLPPPSPPPPPAPKLKPKTRQSFSAAPPLMKALEPPTVVIDHSYQKTLAVRIKIPSKPDQFLRINVIGSCMRTPQFPPPQKRTFVQHCLKQAFRASEMSYHKLMSIVGNIENNSENENKDAVLAYLDKWKRVIGTLENDVQRNFQIFDAKTTQSNVINLEDDNDEIDGLKWGWFDAATRMDFGSDDIQILEEKPKNNNKRKAEEVPSPRKRRKATHDPLIDTSEPGPSNCYNGYGSPAADQSAVDPLADIPREDSAAGAIQSSDSACADSSVPGMVGPSDCASADSSVSTMDLSTDSNAPPDSATACSSVSTTDLPTESKVPSGDSVPADSTNSQPDTTNGDSSHAPEVPADLLPDVLNGNGLSDPLLGDPLSVVDSSGCEDSENVKIEKLSKVIEEICDSSLAQQGAEPDLMNLLDGDLVLERQND